jgi:hypothetical protein
MESSSFWVIVAMGHGAELVVASLFLYRAISNKSVLVRAERPLYATVAFVIIALDVRLGVELLPRTNTDAASTRP